MSMYSVLEQDMVFLVLGVEQRLRQHGAVGSVKDRTYFVESTWEEKAQAEARVEYLTEREAHES
jgi:hypothetical protein